MTPEQRRPPDGKAVGLMLVLCMVWAFQQVLMKASEHDVSPLLQVSLRSGVAALLVLLMMRWQGESLSDARGTWRAGLLAGLLFGLEFFFVAAAVPHTSASHLAVLLYTAPIFAALGLAWWLPSERLRPVQWAGVVLAFVGVAVTFLWRQAEPGGASSSTLRGDALALLGGLFWGATTVVVRTTGLAQSSAKLTLLYQLVGAFVVLLLLAWPMGHTVFKSTPLAWGSLAFQTLVGAFASFLAWFWLLRQYLASRLGVFAFTTPLFAMAFGAWLLGERVEPTFAIGAAMVMAGVVMVSGDDAFKAWQAARTQAKHAEPTR